MYKKMFYGNVTLLVCMSISWLLHLMTVYNLLITIRHSIEGLRSVYSGNAVLFMFLGIVIWFIFALIATGLSHTMTFGVWFMFITVFLSFLSYLHKRYYVVRLSKAEFTHQLLTESNGEDQQDQQNDPLR